VEESQTQVEADRPRTSRIFILIGLLLFALAASLGGLWVLFEQVTRDEIYRKELSVVSKELAESQARDRGRLSSYAQLDGKAGVYQMPIAQAMQLLLDNPKLIEPLARPAASRPADGKERRP
jgi:hypothetical protein